MDTVDKMNFAFNAYDFDSTGTLYFDEVTLLFRACSQGLAKVFPTQTVFTSTTNAEAESYATLFFKSVDREITAGNKILSSEFNNYCSTHPVISSWLKMVGVLALAVPMRSEVSGLDDIDVLSYRSWPNQIPLTAPVCRFKRIVRPLELASTVTESDFAPPPPPEPVVEVVGMTPIAAATSSTNNYNNNNNSQSSQHQSQSQSQSQQVDEITAEEDEILELARKEAEMRANSAPPPRPSPLTWFPAANRMIPEDAPTGRKDPSQDTLTPVWVHGFGSSSAPRMRRNCVYSSTGAILYPASNHVVALKKDEEGVWSQKILSEHVFPLTCLDIDSTGTKLATADRIVGYDSFGKPLSEMTSVARINIWDLQSGSVSGNIAVSPSAVGVRLLDFSANGKYLLALLEDAVNTVTIYDTTTCVSVFTRQLFEPSKFNQKNMEAEKILDIKFSGTNSIFATAGTNGVTFYVEEGTSFMGTKGFKSYDKRKGLYQTIGKAAESTVASALARFEFPDETISGTTVNIYF